ncbi:MAG: hypothetical protein JWM57_1876 [Phycisphaerales bacterium]|nr:hypothetical protein [Phycisphaerales bacterium]
MNPAAVLAQCLRRVRHGSRQGNFSLSRTATLAVLATGVAGRLLFRLSEQRARAMTRSLVQRFERVKVATMAGYAPLQTMFILAVRS